MAARLLRKKDLAERIYLQLLERRDVRGREGARRLAAASLEIAGGFIAAQKSVLRDLRGRRRAGPVRRGR